MTRPSGLNFDYPSFARFLPGK